MRPKYWVYPYGPSNTAMDLVEGLKGRLILRENSRYAYQNGDIVINWGAGRTPPNLVGRPVLNKFEAVYFAISKLRTFGVLQSAQVPIPRVTRNREEAQEWANTGKVLGRDADTGHSGSGITVYRRGSEVGAHQFYTDYWTKNREFRIHVLNGQIIFQQEKVRKRDADNLDPYVRSHTRGWGFAFNHLETSPVPDVVRTTGLSAVRALGLDFGGVDIGWNRTDGAAVFEVNTAPGLENTSLAAYITAFGRL